MNGSTWRVHKDWEFVPDGWLRPVEMIGLDDGRGGFRWECGRYIERNREERRKASDPASQHLGRFDQAVSD